MDADLTLNIHVQTFHRYFILQESGIKELHENNILLPAERWHIEVLPGATSKSSVLYLIKIFEN